MNVRYFAVMYPSAILVNINAAMAVRECVNEAEVLLVLAHWREEFANTGRRFVYRREIEERAQ